MQSQNQTSATRVIILDNHFNPTVSDKCISRAHRFGQQKQVFCYRLAIIGTLEAKVYARSTNKASVASCVVDGEYTTQTFTKDQLKDLNASECWYECIDCKKSRRIPCKFLDSKKVFKRISNIMLIL